MTAWKVRSYRIYQYAGRDSGTRAVIRLEREDGPDVVHACFTTASPLPKSSFSSSLQFFYYPFDMFAPMMEMLREEKPIWVYSEDEENLYIGTHDEPVGEAEP